VVIDPQGRVAYQREGRVDVRAVRTAILSTVPDNPTWPGIKAYYTDVLARMTAARR